MTKQYSGEAFKRSIIRYAFGRIFNALLGFAVFVWIAKELPAAEYAIYVAAFALLEVGLVVAGFGMEWVTGVFVPQVRLNASGRQLWRFIWECAAIQAATLLLGAGVLYLLAPLLSEWFRLSGAEGAIRMYAVVMFVEGVSRVFRDQLLSCLLLQGAAQLSQLARNITLLLVVIWIFADENLRTAEGLAMAEIGASAVSLALAIALLIRYLLAAKNDQAASTSWAPPDRSTLIRVARNAWVSNLANLTWGWSVVVLLVARTLGPELTAALGFARNLADPIRRYMPMEFLLSIMRTFLVARYSLDRDENALAARVGLLYKANLLFLVPLLIVVTVHGDEICAILSGGRYSSAQWLLVGWLCVLVALAHHRLTDVMAHALSRSALTTRASLLLAVTPLAVLSSAQLGSLALLFLVLFTAEALYSVIVILALRLPNWTYSPDWIGLGKIGIASVIATGALLTVPPRNGLWALIAVVGLAYGVVWITVWVLKPWTCQEFGVLPARVRNWMAIRR